ncbi:MAG: hypothetical protein RAO92_07850 [Candidatus Euphemobacter frigidus]|nr:hypothetical protein [Candidatus Euphemobacter frigidus]MDP8276300.1 hypothetical protein [Candidatus Euphemobacter frigidus]
MKGGAWIWILIALFMVFRLLLLAGKKKKEEASPKPTPPRPGPHPHPPQPGRGEEVDELKSFIDLLSGKFRQQPEPPEMHIPQPEEMERPPPPIRKRDRVKKTIPIHKPPSALTTPAPDEGRGRIQFAFVDNPIVQGIILSEVLGPPRGLQGRGRLPSDSSTQRR